MTTRSLVRLTLLAVVAVLAVEVGSYAAYRAGRYYATINVRYGADVSAARRSEIEGALGLGTAEGEDGRTRSYRLFDYSPERMRAVVTHPAIEDTAYIDRAAFAAQRLVAEPLPEPSLVRVARGVTLAVTVAAALLLVLTRVPLPVWLWRSRVPVAVAVAMAAGGARARLHRLSRPTAAAVMFSAGFVPLAAASGVAAALHPEWRHDTIYQRGLRLPARGEFLSQDPDILDHDVYYHGLDGWIDHARQADVIFTGNSRAVYAFRDTALAPHFDRLGLTYYSLAFPGGADVFPLALIRRYDLRPKVLVVNVHGFFANDITRFGKWAMERDWWAGWNLVRERQASWNTRYTLHQLLPHWPTNVVHRRGRQVIYRSAENGSWRWILPANDNKPIGDFPVPRNAGDPQENADIERWTGIMTTYAPGFLAEMEARGTRVVLVYVPWADPVGYFSAVNLAEALGRQLVVAWPDGLKAATGSHIGEQGARRYVEALVPKLLETPEFQTAFPQINPQTRGGH